MKTLIRRRARKTTRSVEDVPVKLLNCSKTCLSNYPLVRSRASQTAFSFEDVFGAAMAATACVRTGSIQYEILRHPVGVSRLKIEVA